MEWFYARGSLAVRGPGFDNHSLVHALSVVRIQEFFNKSFFNQEKTK
jgi:hypothetical protein